MRNVARWMACALCLAPVAAGAAPAWTDIDAKPLIERCWSISEQDRGSGITARMRRGTVNTIHCLEEEIIRHATAFFETRNEEQIRQFVVNIGRPYAELYWVMYNENKGCEPSCGTVAHLFHVGALSALFEDTLRDLSAQRNEYQR